MGIDIDTDSPDGLKSISIDGTPLERDGSGFSISEDQANRMGVQDFPVNTLFTFLGPSGILDLGFTRSGAEIEFSYGVHFCEHCLGKMGMTKSDVEDIAKTAANQVYRADPRYVNLKTRSRSDEPVTVIVWMKYHLLMEVLASARLVRALVYAEVDRRQKSRNP